MYLLLFRSSLIFTSFVRFTPKYFLFWCYGKWYYFIISISNCSLLVHVNTTDFCRLIDQLRSILDREEQRQLKKLEEEERKGLNIIAEAEGELMQQSQSLRELISDLERRCQGSTTELLQVGIAKEPEVWRSRQREANFPSLLMWDSLSWWGKEKNFLWPCSASSLLNSSKFMDKAQDN